MVYVKPTAPAPRGLQGFIPAMTVDGGRFNNFWGHGVIGNAVALQASVRGSIPRDSTNFILRSSIG